MSGLHAVERRGAKPVDAPAVVAGRMGVRPARVITGVGTQAGAAAPGRPQVGISAQ